MSRAYLKGSNGLTATSSSPTQLQQPMRSGIANGKAMAWKGCLLSCPLHKAGVCTWRRGTSRNRIMGRTQPIVTATCDAHRWGHVMTSTQHKFLPSFEGWSTCVAKTPSRSFRSSSSRWTDDPPQGGPWLTAQQSSGAQVLSRKVFLGFAARPCWGIFQYEECQHLAEGPEASPMGSRLS